MTTWLDTGIEKLAALQQHPSCASQLELSPIEYRSVCAHYGLNKEALSEAAQASGIPKVAAVAIVLEKTAELNKEGILPELALGGGVALGTKALWPWIKRVGGMFKGVPMGITKQRQAVERATEAIKKMPEHQRKRILGEVARESGVGMVSGGPLAWDWRDYLKMLGLGVGGIGAWELGKRAIPNIVGPPRLPPSAPPAPEQRPGRPGVVVVS